MKRISVCTHVLFLLSALGAFAQLPPEPKPVLTTDDYARAEKMLGYSTGQLVDRSNVRPNFLPDGRFWYRVLTATSSEYVLVNPTDGSRQTGANLAALGITAPLGGGAGRFGGTEVASPDGKKSAYIKNFNLYVKDLATGKETQLTTDGVKDFGYATDNAGWKKSDRAIVVWSPDSTRIATFQQDERNVSDTYLVS